MIDYLIAYYGKIIGPKILRRDTKFKDVSEAMRSFKSERHIKQSKSYFPCLDGKWDQFI